MTTQFEAQCTCISARLFLGKSGRDGCGMVVAEVGPEQNLALHLVLLASGKEWTRRWEREREWSITVRFWASGQRGSLEKELLSGYSGSGSPHSQM